MFVYIFLCCIAGPLAENTHPQIKDKIEEMLVSKESFEPQKAKEVMDSTWTDTPEDMAIKLTANVPLLFQRLKNEGVKVRILLKSYLFENCHRHRFSNCFPGNI